MGKFVVYTNDHGVRFNLKASNGEIVATSEIYASRQRCLDGIDSVRRNALVPVEDLTLEDAEPLRHPKYELYQDKAGAYRFRLKARNGEIIAASEGYTTKQNCLGGIESIGKNAPTAEIVDAE